MPFGAYLDPFGRWTDVSQSRELDGELEGANHPVSPNDLITGFPQLCQFCCHRNRMDSKNRAHQRNFAIGESQRSDKPPTVVVPVESQLNKPSALESRRGGGETAEATHDTFDHLIGMTARVEDLVAEMSILI